MAIIFQFGMPVKTLLNGIFDIDGKKATKVGATVFRIRRGGEAVELALEFGRSAFPFAAGEVHRRLQTNRFLDLSPSSILR